jgi:hypothetical protein
LFDCLLGEEVEGGGHDLFEGVEILKGHLFDVGGGEVHLADFLGELDPSPAHVCVGQIG